MFGMFIFEHIQEDDSLIWKAFRSLLRLFAPVKNIIHHDLLPEPSGLISNHPHYLLLGSGRN